MKNLVLIYDVLKGSLIQIKTLASFGEIFLCIILPLVLIFLLTSTIFYLLCQKKLNEYKNKESDAKRDEEVVVKAS
ncbi:MAG: hypothetical protein RBQ97_11925 [Acholeplasma sp.]|nr:hypothetical protein [Acholeplasma sp.]